MPLGQDYLRLVLSRWKLVVGLVVGCTLAGWLFSALILAQKPTFTAAARLNIVPTSEELGYANRFVRGSTFDGGSVLLQTYAEFAHTRPIVAPIVDRFIREQAAASDQSEAAWIAANSVPPAFSPGRIVSLLNYGETPPVPLRDDLIDNVIKYTTIENVEGTYLIRISVEWDDAKAAAWFANALADAIVARAETMSRQTGNQIADSLADRLAQKKAALATTLRQSRDLKASVGVVDIDRQKQSLLEAQVLEQSQLTSDRAQLQSNERQVAGLRRQTGGKLSSAQQVLEQTLAVEGPKAQGLKQGIAIRERRVGQITAQIAALGKYEDRIKALDDAAVALQTEVTALTERVSFSQTENLANAPRIQLIERATPPLVRSSPKTLFNTALGFIAGCALAGCALLVLGGAVTPPREEPVEEAEETPVARAAPPLHAVPDAPAPTDRPGSGAWSGVERRRFVPSIAGGAAMAIRAPVLDEIEPLVAPVVHAVPDTPDSPHLFTTRLARPMAGGVYGAGEIAEVGHALAAWLGDAIAADGRPLLIAAEGPDLDAQHLFQLVYGHLREADVRVRTIDATKGGVGSGDAEGIKPLIYGGGFDESGRIAVLADLPPAFHVLIAVVAKRGEDVAAVTDAARRRFAAIARRQPHVVAFAG